MRIRLLTLCFFGSLAIDIQGAAAEVEADIKYIFYPVKPEPGLSLHKQIFKDTPLRHKDRPVAGMTDWNIKYERTYARSGKNLCEIKTYKVTYYCTITLPRLETDDAKLRSDFNAYLPLLKEHELTHCRI
jgi:Predicted secreted Zn-dependent protease